MVRGTQRSTGRHSQWKQSAGEMYARWDEQKRRKARDERVRKREGMKEMEEEQGDSSEGEGEGEGEDGDAARATAQARGEGVTHAEIRGTRLDREQMR